MGFVVNMRNVGKPVSEGTYNVMLTKVEAKKTAKGDDQLVLTATIKDEDSEWNGRPLIRRFVLPTVTDPTKDVSGILFYMQQALIAFGADEDELADEEVDVAEIGSQLIGNEATAEVTHQENERNPNQPFVNANFVPSGL